MASLSITVRAWIIAGHYLLMQIGNDWFLKDIWELPDMGAKLDN